MLERLKEMKKEAVEEIRNCKDQKQLEQVRISYLGKKGRVTQILRSMGDLDPELRPQVGSRANALKQELTKEIEDRQQELEQQLWQKRLEREGIDITIPGRRPRLGHLHPLTRTLNEIKEIFLGLGFTAVEGPEVETEYYNFQALNVPPNHPARDMQDTFYFTDQLLLRTQTSPVQIRVMEKHRPPLSIIAPGRVYRCDADISHSPMFHQVEGLLVAEGVRFSDLKGTLIRFARSMFGQQRGVRFRPSYFPFTEPSAEMDISCFCEGEGCRVCSETGWIEILGSGMVHPNVLRNVDYDPRKYSGFAFGMGIDRIAMLKYGIDDIRLLFENDMRFLNQF